MADIKRQEILHFEYQEDLKFFANILSNGNTDLFFQKYNYYFDFRNPSVKRKEFNKIRGQIFKKLVLTNGLKCQLRIHPDCSKVKKFNVDHLIPLSSNELNKKIRKMRSVAGKKVPSQSFGSNSIENLQIVCSRCNAFKKHRIMGFASL